MEKFICYSQRLYRALVDNGFKPLYIRALNKDRICSEFEKTKQLVDFVENTYQSLRDKY